MPKHFINSKDICDGKIFLNGGDARHIISVLRVRPGDTITLCDGNENDYCFRVTDINRSMCELSAEMINTIRSETESRVRVTLYQAIPKADKMDLIVQKCVELGVFSIVPVLTEHIVFRGTDLSSKLVRWRTIAKAAAGQSMRGIVPEIAEPLRFMEVVGGAGLDEGLHIAAHEKEKAARLCDVLSGLRVSYGFRVFMWVGPEGGFSDYEIGELKKSGAKTVSLGPRILRTETAAISMMAQVIYAIEGAF